MTTKGCLSGLAAVLALLAVTLSPPTVSAQDSRAKVSGTIADVSEGVVANAEVVLTNVNTGISIKRTTGSNGQYIFDLVEAGTYRLTAEYSGFSRFVQENIVVQVRADVTVNAKLAPGTATQQITVSDAPPPLEFSTSTASTTIDRKMLTDLPILARNPFSLALLDASVVNTYFTTRNPFYMWSSTGLDVAGSTSNRLDLLFDGAPLTLTNKGSYSPPMDAVQEFTVQRNSVDAEFGFSGGATMSVAMRSGTNGLHGTAYYFGRNPALNAVTNAITRTPSTVRNHIWGGSLGNPVKKDKLFTFTAWEQWRTKNPRTRSWTLPTDAERQGRFSNSLNAMGGLRTIYDPSSSHLDASTGAYVRTPYAGNVIPASQIDPTASKAMSSIWEPNSAGDDITGVNNYRETYSDLTKYWNFSNRTDYNITDKLRVFGRYSQFHTTVDELHRVSSIAMPHDDGGIMHSINIAGDAVYTLSPTSVLNVSGSYTAIKDDYWSPSSVGESGLSNLWSNNWYAPYSKDMKAIYYPNFYVGGSSFGNRWYWFEHPKNTALSAKLIKTLGAHSVKIGIQYRRDFGFINYPDLMYFQFDAGLTANAAESPNTLLYGSPWATFLTGALDSNSTAGYSSPQELNVHAYGGYVQDDYRISKRFTLNYGLRYEYSTAPTDAQNRISRYLDLTNAIPEFQTNPVQMPSSVTSISQIAYKYNGAWMFADDNNRGMYRTSKISFMPRIGGAFELTPKTALRAGYSRFIIPPSQTTPFQSTSIPLSGYSARTYVASVLAGNPQATLSNPFPSTNPLILPTGNSLGRYQNLGSPAQWEAQDMRTGSQDRVTVSVQHQVLRNLVAEATYMLNYGGNQPYSKSLNMLNPQLSYDSKSVLDTVISNPFYMYGTAKTFPGQLRYQPTVTIARLLTEYPQYGSLTQMNTPGVETRYQAFGARVQRPFTSGFSLLWSYNYNHQSRQEFFNPIDQYANHFTFIDSTTPRHRMNVAGTYELPLGKGRRYIAQAPGLVNAFLGGWSTSAIFNYNSGDFLRFGQMIVNGDPRIDNPNRSRYFNTGVFSAPTAYTSRTNPWQYDGVTGPRSANVDATLSKFFPLHESLQLELKIEAYNMTNSFMASDPSTDVYSSLFGRSTGQANGGREMQYTLRLHF